MSLMRGKNESVVPVVIESGIRWVYLCSPKVNEIPHSNIIIATLNAALITRFSYSKNRSGSNFGVCFASEGGIQGFYKGVFVELRNMIPEKLLGLWSEEPSRESLEVLKFYHIMMNYLLEADSRNVGDKYFKGEILGLEESMEGFDRACQILADMLAIVRGKKFSMMVAENLRTILEDPILTMGIQGR